MKRSISREELQFVAGLIDGDGCIRLESPRLHQPRPIPLLSLKQARAEGVPPELSFVQGIFGGAVYRSENTGTNWRCTWTLRITALKEIEVLLGAISECAVLKLPQIDRALEYLRADRKDATAVSEFLKMAKKDYQTIRIDSARLTSAYLAGLFAAEGSLSYVWHKSVGAPMLRSSIAQSNCIAILAAIRETMGFGFVRSGQIHFSCRQTLKLLEMIRPYMYGSQKAPQVDEVFEYVRTKTSGSGHKRTAEEEQKLKEISQKLKIMKRG